MISTSTSLSRSNLVGVGYAHCFSVLHTESFLNKVEKLRYELNNTTSKDDLHSCIKGASYEY